MAELPRCLYVLSAEINGLGIRDCSSARKTLSKPKCIWSICVRLEITRSWRDLVIFNLAIDSKLRASDLVKLRLGDICSGAKVRHRATIVQKKTGRPVQFEITTVEDLRLKPGCRCSGPLAPDISSQVDFMQALTYPPANMHGWCITGSGVSA